MITIAQPIEELKEVVAAFRDGGGDGTPILLHTRLSYGPTEDEALRAAHEQWRTNIFAGPVLADLRMPEDFTAAAEFVESEDTAESIIVAADLAEHVERIQELVELGFEEILLHNVHRDQETFIRGFGARVLPELER